MADKAGGKSTDRNKRKAVAGRLAYLRSVRFETQGFKSNAPIPSVSEARVMHGYNLRLFASQKPMPSVKQ